MSVKYVEKRLRDVTDSQSLTSCLSFIGRIAFAVLLCDIQRSNAASFDCSKAKTPTDILICHDSELSKLDDRLAQSYIKALSNHPLPSYIKSQQKNWIGLLPYVDPTNRKMALVEQYTSQIKYLDGVSISSKVYVNQGNNKLDIFCFECGDSVAEIWNSSGKDQVRIYGGFHIHNLASQENGKKTYVGCEFSGEINADRVSSVGSEGNKITFSSNESSFIVSSEQEQFCGGFGALSSSKFLRKN